MESIYNKRQLLNDIEEMKQGDLEEMALITFYSLGSYFKSLFTFGYNNDVTRDNLNVIKEMFQILKTERILLNYILKHIDKVDIDATADVLGMLDRANDETVRFYYNVLDDIEDAVEARQEWRGLRRKQTSPTLIQSFSYASEVVALSENMDSLKEFLGFENEFWEYIEKNMKVVNTTGEIARNICYAVPLYNGQEIVSGFLVMVPKVVDLETALLAIQILIKAHDIYLCMGNKYDFNIGTDIEAMQKRYENEYILEKAQKVLKKM